MAEQKIKCPICKKIAKLKLKGKIKDNYTCTCGADFWWPKDLKDE